MSAVWKVPLQMEGQQLIKMPVGAELLTVQVQNDQPQIWARVDPTAPVADRRIIMVGTGHQFTDDDHKYVGTFQLMGGGFIGHVFDGRSGTGKSQDLV